MASQILVALRRSDRVEEMVAYVEKVAQPGGRVVFLVPYPVDLWLYIGDHWVEVESAREAILAGRRLGSRYSWHVQKALAEQKIAPAQEVLARKGVEVAVDLYTGSLKRVLKDYEASGEIYLVIIRALGGRLLANLLQRIAFPFSLSRLPSSLVLLLNANNP
ncbi:MAG: hypothetical protein HYV04_20910 [Deltaproteobacteria bacterium]|nr:hypothetical protein [Deltaproteobacteria bacterium]